MTSEKPAASTFLSVSVTPAGEPRRTKDLRQVLRFHIPEPFNHVDEISIARWGVFRGGGQCRNDAFPVVAYLARSLLVLLFRRIREMREVAAHQAPRRRSVPRAGFVIEVRHLLEPTEGHGRCKGRHDHPAAEARRKLD